MFKSQKELMQALMNGKRIRKDSWWKHCYLRMDEDGMIYDEEEHRYTLNLRDYDQFREITPTDYKFLKLIREIEVNKLSCVSEDINCNECPLLVEGNCLKADLISALEKCQSKLGE